jgi:hypothetical protein
MAGEEVKVFEFAKSGPTLAARSRLNTATPDGLRRLGGTRASSEDRCTCEGTVACRVVACLRRNSS